MNRPTPEELAAKGLCRAEKFKDRACGYDGPENWCDRTESRCIILENDDRFDLAKPPLAEPFHLPWWSMTSALGMIGTMMLVHEWRVAGILYIFFSLLLIPPARMGIYYRYVHPIWCWVRNKDTLEDK